VTIEEEIEQLKQRLDQLEKSMPSILTKVLEEIGPALLKKWVRQARIKLK
jgi:hypothetical protein